MQVIQAEKLPVEQDGARWAADVSAQPQQAEETALYRVRGDGELLLYIGISKDFGKRWKEHAKKQPWWNERRSLSVDKWYASREEAEAAEIAAIKAERPKYNKQHAVRPMDSEPEYPIEPGVSAPADLSGWLTVAEAAKKYGRSEPGIYAAHNRGLVEGRRFWRTPLLVSETDVALWVKRPRTHMKSLPSRMTTRQAEFLLDVHLGRDNQDYGAAIVTQRALRKRGLLVAVGVGLTAEGERVARELHQQQSTEVIAA